MSKPETKRLGSRENFFEYDRGEYEADNSERTGHTEKPGVNREKWIAKSILYSHPDSSVLCPSCWHELDAARELSDPEDYVEPARVVVDERYLLDADDDRASHDEEDDVDLDTLAAEGWSLFRELDTELRYADHRRHRYCPECARVSWGGVLADLPKSEFYEVVEDVLDAVGYVPAGRREDLRNAAHDRKRGGWSDSSNIEALVRDLTTGTDSE